MRVSAIVPGDLVELDKKGRRFIARVLEVKIKREPAGVAERVLSVEPVCPGVSYRHARPREVIGHWARAGRRRRPTRPPAELVRQERLEC
jgi:hypothetical protein